MHNCRRIESQLVDLFFDEVDANHRLRLLTEIESCADCLGQYQSLSDTLYVFDRTAAAAQPPEHYWTRYSQMLREKLNAPMEAARPVAVAPAPFWKRLLTARLPLPVPVAAALVVGLIISSALAFRRAPAQAQAAAPPIVQEKIVEVPVVQEKIVTRTVYVERKRAARSLLPVVARADRINDAAIASNQHEDEAGFFTRANLKGFQPADDMKIRVLKRNDR